jgi:hypothetical protein
MINLLAWWWACMHDYCGFAIVIKEISWWPDHNNTRIWDDFIWEIQWYDFTWVSLKSYELDLWFSDDLIEISHCYSLFILWIKWLLFGLTAYTMGPQLEWAQWWWNDFVGCYDPMRQIATIDPTNDAQGWGFNLIWIRTNTNRWLLILYDDLSIASLYKIERTISHSTISLYMSW